MTFYQCEHCGNVIAHLNDSGVRCTCCGEKMKPLVPNTSDGAGEKHVPLIQTNGSCVTVTVSSVEHPMLEEHYIQFVVLETASGIQVKYLNPGEAPHAEFLTADAPVAVYEYCNLHGLWKTEL